MAFKSYSWAIGTTSFRTSQLNYKIERQLQLLKEFWSNNSTKKWTDSVDVNTKLKLTKDEKNHGMAAGLPAAGGQLPGICADQRGSAG